MTYPVAAGAKDAATSVAATAITPSMMTGTPPAAPATMYPRERGDLKAPQLGQNRQRRHVVGEPPHRALDDPSLERQCFVVHAGSSTVTSAAGEPVSAAINAAEGVVFPIPMSPVTNARAPRSSARWASSTPTSSAAVASSWLIAGPKARSAVPRATVRRTSADVSPGMSDATPTSTTTTSAPTCRARTLIAAPPAQKFATIWAVTSTGHGVTPEATTPWSPAKTVTVTGSGTGGGHAPAMALNCTPRDSTRPREPWGFVRRS